MSTSLIHSYEGLSGAYPKLKQLLDLRPFTRQLKLNTVLRNAPGAGNWHTRIKGRGLDFSEVRQYQAGDDIRSIDWRVTAKTQKTHTRLFTQEKERPVILAADMRRSMFFGSQNCFKSVTCAGVLSALAWAALGEKDRVGGLIMGENDHLELRPKASRKTVLALINALADYSQKLSSPYSDLPQQNLDQLFMKLQRISRPGSAVYIASDFYDIETIAVGRLLQLARHCDVTLIFISDPLEWTLSSGGGIWVSNGKEKKVVTQHSGVTALISNRLEKLHEICDPLNIEIITLSTADNLIEKLLKRFSGVTHNKTGILSS